MIDHTMMHPLLTVIIPHKDTPTLLRRCIASIPNRQDIQTIVVDDHTEDVKAVRDLQDIFPAVTFIYNDNQVGPGFSRNIGLEKAEGEWVIFADADDYFDDSFWAFLDSVALDASSDIIYLKSRSVDLDTGKESDRADYYNGLVDRFLPASGDGQGKLLVIFLFKTCLERRFPGYILSVRAPLIPVFRSMYGRGDAEHPAGNGSGLVDAGLATGTDRRKDRAPLLESRKHLQNELIALLLRRTSSGKRIKAVSGDIKAKRLPGQEFLRKGVRNAVHGRFNGLRGKVYSAILFQGKVDSQKGASSRTCRTLLADR